MYIMTADGKQLVNADFIERFCIVDKPDAVLIIASYGSDNAPVTLARYKNPDRAQMALLGLFEAIQNDGKMFSLDNDLGEEDMEHMERFHGGKRRRRGGS